MQVTILEKALAAGPKPVTMARMYMWFMELGHGYAYLWMTRNLDQVAKEEYIRDLLDTALKTLVARHLLIEVVYSAATSAICASSTVQ